MKSGEQVHRLHFEKERTTIKQASVLIIRPGAIGDNLLTLPILQYLRHQHPAASITFVGNKAILPLLTSFGLVDHTSNYEEPQWGELFLPSTSHKKHLQPLLQKTTSVIGWLSDSTGMIEANLLSMGITDYILAPGRPCSAQSQHIVLYLAETMGLPWNNEQDITWRPPDAYRWHEPNQDNAAAGSIIIHPGSGGKPKCWPVAYFAEVITTLWRHQLPVTLLEGPADTERLGALREILPAPAQQTLLRRLVNEPLLTIAQELQQCQCYIGNDSGITHLAALLHVPTIVLFGPSDPTIWHPIGPTTQVIYHQSDITKITPRSVLSQILNIQLHPSD